MSAKRERSSSPDTDDSRETLDYDAVLAEEKNVNKEGQSIKAELKSVNNPPLRVRILTIWYYVQCCVLHVC
jgi:hypothetical protein